MTDLNSAQWLVEACINQAPLIIGAGVFGLVSIKLLEKIGYYERRYHKKREVQKMRAITINKNQSNVYAIVVSHMSNGMKTVETENGDSIGYTDMFAQDGNISMERGQRLCESKYGKNCMCVYVQNIGKAGKMSISGDVFLANSNVCVDGVTYGHDVITREIKSTIAHCMVLENGMPNMVDVKFAEVTTDSKLLNWVREATHCNSAIVISKEIITERRYMDMSTFEALATNTAS